LEQGRSGFDAAAIGSNAACTRERLGPRATRRRLVLLLFCLRRAALPNSVALWPEDLLGLGEGRRRDQRGDDVLCLCARRVSFGRERVWERLREVVVVVFSLLFPDLLKN
jgi:hypothetical protein